MSNADWAFSLSRRRCRRSPIFDWFADLHPVFQSGDTHSTHHVRRLVRVRFTVQSPIVRCIISCAFHSHNDTSGDNARILTDYSSIGSLVMESGDNRDNHLRIHIHAVNDIGIYCMLNLFADTLMYICRTTTLTS